MFLKCPFQQQAHELLPPCSKSPGGGGSLIWPIRGRAAGQGMVFLLFVLNGVYKTGYAGKIFVVGLSSEPLKLCKTRECVFCNFSLTGTYNGGCYL